MVLGTWRDGRDGRVVRVGRDGRCLVRRDRVVLCDCEVPCTSLMLVQII